MWQIYTAVAHPENAGSQSPSQTSVVHYQYDPLYRLTEANYTDIFSGSYTYTYDADAVGNRLTYSSNITSSETMTHTYDAANRLLQSLDQDGLTTTYTFDYARAGQRILLETGSAGSKHYLYGLECIGEQVDAGEPETEEWRYYQRDGRGMVHQTTNPDATVTLAWAYSPDGAVVLGEKGPVTYLDCGSGTVYDWSTGLVLWFSRI